MKLKIFSFLTVVGVIFIFCTEQSTVEIAKDKAQYFDKHGKIVFTNYQIKSLRATRYPSFQVSRYDSSGNSAIIRLKPMFQIEKNFISDSIDASFVKSFAELDCSYLEFRDSVAQIGYSLNSKRYVLYKNFSLRDVKIALDTSATLAIGNGWRLLKLGEN